MVAWQLTALLVSYYEFPVTLKRSCNVDSEFCYSQQQYRHPVQLENK